MLATPRAGIQFGTTTLNVDVQCRGRTTTGQTTSPIMAFRRTSRERGLFIPALQMIEMTVLGSQKKVQFTIRIEVTRRRTRRVA